jgi:hypothetical protein
VRLTEVQSRGLLAKHGVHVSEACDTCGKILGPVRYTRKDQPGVWCSKSCRDGVEHRAGLCRGCGTSLNGKRKDSIYCGRTCRMRVTRKEGQDSQIIVNTPLQNRPLTDAILPSGYGV